MEDKMKIEDVREMGIELEHWLKMRVHPVAVKFLKSKDDVPDGAVIPKKDLGHKLALCQAFSMSEDGNEKTIAMFKEDHYCFEPVIGLGLIKKQEGFFDGTHRYPDSAITLEAGAEWCKNMPYMKEGLYSGMVTAPIHKCNFMPDLIFMHVNGLMLTYLLIVKNYIDGKDLYCQLSGHAACVYALVPAMNERKCKVTIPCRGDRTFARAQDDDMMFTMVPEMLPDFIDGMHFEQKNGWGLPTKRQIKEEYPLLPRYEEYGRKLGLLDD